MGMTEQHRITGTERPACPFTEAQIQAPHQIQRGDIRHQQTTGFDSRQSANSSHVAKTAAASLSRQPEDLFVAKWRKDPGLSARLTAAAILSPGRSSDFNLIPFSLFPCLPRGSLCIANDLFLVGIPVD